MSLPPLPSVSMDGCPTRANAADQPAFSVSLATAYPVQLTGQIVATFAADAEIAIDDAAIQFPTGGRTVNFTIPAGSTTAVFSTSQMALQTGTVAGTITLNLSLQSATGEVTATSTSTLRVLSCRSGHATLQVVHTAGGFELHLTGLLDAAPTHAGRGPAYAGGGEQPANHATDNHRWPTLPPVGIRARHPARSEASSRWCCHSRFRGMRPA